ncbi:ABC transporter ATP-binding protein [Dongia deserti]|uniref:ABC transporter ATP-binding protein n=1 Tax=Dongia deserti TaxID=2268030 RepID=UPI000E6495A3|nr:ABC transporter ATP-binding protein [Dongia deserti]
MIGQATAPRGHQDVHVTFAGVGKMFDAKNWAVRDLNLDVVRGEFLTLLGPSGSGKTTSLMMLAGFEAPTTGEIRMDGRRIDQIPANRRGIGLVFQNYALFPHMTVAENLAFPLQVRRQSRAEVESRVRRVLEMVQLRGKELRRPDQLSGGQQQRVAVARALIFEPKLVLMDEPLGALDKQLREQMQLEIKHIHERLGVTFVYVTHDQAEALTMSTRIAVFNQGAVQQLATPAELYERPATSFVASFIGENNRLTGQIVGDEGAAVLVRLETGAMIRAHTHEHLRRTGARTSLSIRPERADIVQGERSCDNELTAKVAEVVYAGDHLRIVLDAPEMRGFVVKKPNTAGLTAMAPGQIVRVGWRADDCLALDA